MKDIGGRTLTSFEVLIEDMSCLRIFAILLDNNTRATHDLASIPIPIYLAKARPFTQDLRVSDLNEGDGVRGAKRFDEFDVLRLRAGLNKHTEVGLTPVQGLCALTQATSQTIVFERLLQNLLMAAIKIERHVSGKSSAVHLKCLLDRQLSLGCLRDFGNFRCFDLYVISSVRHPELVVRKKR